MHAIEVNFDGLVGPTHNYAGLSFGNLASSKNEGLVARPRDAALQGLEKMAFLHDLGLTQAVLPPLPRPHPPLLRQLGFSGSPMEMIAAVERQAPWLLPRIYSASSMWAANAATVSPSADTADGRVHFTPANLVTHLHRAIEPPDTARLLKAIFRDERHFAHHAQLPANDLFGDEGAANHIRLATRHGDAGVEIFVYGRDDAVGERTRTYPARQTLAASQAVARLHGLDTSRTLFVRQHPDAIDAGVFHNDVISVGNGDALLYHELAFADGEAAVDRMGQALGQPLHRLKIAAADVPVADAVTSYLFNSQLLTLPDGGMVLIAPTESEENPVVHAALEALRDANDNPLQQIHFRNLRESMRNGGGPACLRLRVVLTEAERQAAHPGIFFTPTLHARLKTFVEQHYRETLHPRDLADPLLLKESLDAQVALLNILDLTAHYQPEALEWATY